MILTYTYQQNRLFTLCTIAQTPYLLPFGQRIADLQKGLQLNTTGVFIWGLLEKKRTKEELFALCSKHFEAAREEEPELEQDVSQFLHTLYSYGMVERFPVEDCAPSVFSSWGSSCSSAPSQGYLRIGGLTLALCGPKEAFSEKFSPFATPDGSLVHQTITVLLHEPFRHTNGELILRRDELMVLDCPSHYIFLFPSCPAIREAQLRKDGSQVVFYTQPPCDEAFREALFHAIRLPFLYLAQQQHMAVLHSASLLYRNRAWLFSGHSGAGKSTHTGLWREAFGVPLLNGDLNLVERSHSTAVVHGLPWCGTSAIFTTKTYPLGGIIFLQQAPHNSVEALQPAQKQLFTAQRMITPVFTAEQLHTNLQLAEEITESIFTCRLHCTKDTAAARIMREAIDAFCG